MAKKGGRAKKTVTTQFHIISMIFGYAVESSDIEYSPCDHISIPKNLPKGRREAATKIKKPKTAAGIRTVPILDPLAKHLPKRGTSYLFSLDGRETPLTEMQYQKLWRS